MGLDMVEIVMETEERFGIKLDSVDFTRVRTVADFAVCVSRQLPTSIAVSPKVETFRRVRDLMISEAGIERRLIRPGAKLDELFASNRRVRWKRLRAKEARLPPLELPHVVDRLIVIPAGIAICGVIGLPIALIAVRGWPKPLMIATVCAIVLGTFVLVLNRVCRTRFPDGCRTVRELCDRLTLYVGPSDSDGVKLLWQIRVLDEVRRITADTLGLPIEKVKPESRFVEDLGVD